MIPDQLQYLLDDFWNDQKIDYIWTLGPRIYHLNILKHTRQSMGISLKIISSYLRISNSESIGRFVHRTFPFVFLNLWNLKIENFENCKFRDCQTTWTFEETYNFVNESRDEKISAHGRLTCKYEGHQHGCKPSLVVLREGGHLSRVLCSARCVTQKRNEHL